MPQRAVTGGQDWGSVNVGSGSIRKKAVPKTAAGIDAAKKAGLIATERRYGAGGNSSAHSGANINARKLEESEDLKHSKVDKSLSKAIMQARTAKKKTQKELATMINEKIQVVQEYESGKAIPNGAIIGKIERALGCKLPRPGKKPAPKKAAGGSAMGGAAR
eukprot:CAMPEP_0172488798 /NCGR_PEP_ID=MMETSP1066-20121228/18526_1 /TAXON_ID=671091 /ORGANISM="Coscinodiscus wailesii, Strain CCMP2513" /LENGTH=161 /DNA_ID=CAMNT_0013256261 /DNA_START=180 /DNA_END=662 /DNA_ORIENTATION=-